MEIVVQLKYGQKKGPRKRAVSKIDEEALRAKRWRLTESKEYE